MRHNDAIISFAPFERTAPAELARQSEMFIHADMTRLLDFVPDSILILNKERQTVFANKAALDLLHITPGTNIIGLRMGEVVNCRNAVITTGGCGTSRFCRYCGGANSILTSSNDNMTRVEECHLLTKNGSHEEPLDLRVQASPFEVNDERFTFCVLSNIADEKAGISLERMVQHDILNSAVALSGFFGLFGESADENQRDYMRRRIALLCQRIIDEIITQRQLKAAEHDELVPRTEMIETLDFLKTLASTYSHEAAHDLKVVRIDADALSTHMTTDKKLLNQVIGNMIKNALEASHSGEAVTINCSLHNGMINFSVSNPAFIPEQVQAHIFSRSFSTRGDGKGLGTYSMKYLTEKYLRGTISFVTDEQQGTTFTAAYPLEL